MNFDIFAELRTEERRLWFIYWRSIDDWSCDNSLTNETLIICDISLTLTFAACDATSETFNYWNRLPFSPQYKVAENSLQIRVNSFFFFSFFLFFFFSFFRIEISPNSTSRLLNRIERRSKFNLDATKKAFSITIELNLENIWKYIIR